MEKGYLYITKENGILLLDKELPSDLHFIADEHNRIMIPENTTIDSVLEAVFDSMCTEIAVVCDENAAGFSAFLVRKMKDELDRNITLLVYKHLSGEPRVSKEDPYAFLVDSETVSPAYMGAMSNGYIAYKTGVYPQTIATTKAKHISVDSDCFKRFLPLYSGLLDINSALFIHHSESDDPAIEINDFSSEYVSHIHNEFPNAVRFDTGVFSYPTREINYAEYKKNCDLGRSEQTCHFLRIENNEDLSAFGADLTQFATHGRVADVNPYMIDECRWSNACSIKTLVRYYIRSDGTIQTCLSSNNAFANIHEGLYAIQIKASREKEIAQICRKCSSCVAKDYCSKCCCLPDGITVNDFCDFMRKQPILPWYFSTKSVLRYLYAYSQIVRDNYHTMTVSHYLRPLVMRLKDLPNSARTTLANSSLVFCADGKYYVFSIKTNQILELDKRLVFIFEWITYGGEGNMENAYCECLNIANQALVGQQLSDGKAILKQAGII